MQAVADWLERKGASNDLLEWARPYGGELERLWNECPRGDWLLSIAARLGVESRLLVQAASGCARLALAHLPEAEPRPARALDAVDAYCRGELDAGACAAHKQHVMDALETATEAATGAASVAVQAALDALSDRDAAVNAAAFAAQAAVLAAGDCAMMEALRFTQRRSAQLVRQAIAAEQVAARWRAHTASARPS